MEYCARIHSFNPSHMKAACNHHNSSGSSDLEVYVHENIKFKEMGSVVDERKRRRMQSNRESARRSRVRKQKYLEDLLREMGKLKGDNGEISSMVDTTEEQCVKLEAENAVLKTQMEELAEKLNRLNSVLVKMKRKTGEAMDTGDTPDPLVKPWQLPFHYQLVAASAKMLHW